MLIVCLDLEGVLVPEIWIAFARQTGIDGFARTTRDEPDYDRLMRYRIDLLRKHALRLPDIQAVIARMEPLPGAADFLAALRQRYQVAILSDTFYEFAAPLMAQLGWPTLLCHHLSVDRDGQVTGYRLRQREPKKRAVQAFQALNYKVLAAGDSFNDMAMLEAADSGFFIHPPPAIAAQFPQFPVHSDFDSLRASFDAAAARLESS